MSSYDAVVVGAGPNGLVAANHLADAGWSVLVLEAQDRPGGAVRTDSELDADFRHDTFSSFYPLGALSPAILPLRLEDHGLRWAHAPAVLGHPFGAGRWAILRRDRDVNAAHLEEHCPGDGDAWLELTALWDRIGGPLAQSLMSPFPPVRSGLSMLGALGAAGPVGALRTLLAPVADLARSRFRGPAPGLLLAGNACHADIPLDAPGSGLMGLLMTMLGQQVGFPAPVGGAGELTAALVRRLESRGGIVRTGARVDAVEVDRRRATGVRLAGGEVIGARRGVLADVSAPSLYGGLVDVRHLPARARIGMRRFRLDPATVKVDLALSGPVPWSSAPPAAPGTVHVSDSVDELATAFHQIEDGSVPAEPFLLVGQMSTTDPTRSPAGTEALWAYTHVPQDVRRDAGGAGIRGVWDASDCERFADRMLARLERLAPGLGDRVTARRVLGPRELEERDANLVGGALGGGTARLRQQVFLRPIPGLARAETPIRGLYLASAAAHPGGGVHGAPGHNAARAALTHARRPG